MKRIEFSSKAEFDSSQAQETGGGGGLGEPTNVGKFAKKLSHNRAENRPRLGQKLHKQWIFDRAAPPPKFYSLSYALAMHSNRSSILDSNNSKFLNFSDEPSMKIFQVSYFLTVEPYVGPSNVLRHIFVVEFRSFILYCRESKKELLTFTQVVNEKTGKSR